MDPWKGAPPDEVAEQHEYEATGLSRRVGAILVETHRCKECGVTGYAKVKRGVRGPVRRDQVRYSARGYASCAGARVLQARKKLFAPPG